MKKKTLNLRLNPLLSGLNVCEHERKWKRKKHIDSLATLPYFFFCTCLTKGKNEGPKKKPDSSTVINALDIDAHLTRLEISFIIPFPILLKTDKAIHSKDLKVTMK